jgi:cyclopropane fatty-acyl-phospholipid synthase-like methyltransferase
MDARQHSLPASRNREPILGVLKHVVAPGSRVLEIASGSGEHAVYFAKHLRDVEWQPSDPDPNARASVAAWIEEEGVSNIAAPLDLDVSELGWERALAGQTVDAMLAVNMIHISPWEATLGLMRGARAILSTATRGSGVLYTYGAYKRGGAHTAPSNEAFDAWLKERDERFGVRDLEAVEAIASDHGFMLSEIVEMPANNLSLVFELQAPTKP